MRYSLPTPNAFILFILSLTLVACSTLDVKQDFNPDHDYSHYKTYSWHPGPKPKTGDFRLDNPLLNDRIVKAINNKLTNMGYVLVREDTADLVVTYHLDLDTKTDVSTINTGFSYGSYNYWGSVGYDTVVYEYDEGSLIIDIADHASQKVIWRGSASSRLKTDSSPEKSTELIQNAVNAILDQFPPEQTEKSQSSTSY